MLKRLLKFSLNLVLSFSLFSCATTAPDVPVLTRISPTQGFYVYTMSDKKGIVDDEHLLNGKTWHDYVIESIYVPFESYAELKKFILKMCKIHKCDGIDWKSKLDTIDQQSEKIKSKEIF